MMEEERKWTVYVHENKINGKRYVGITCQKPKRRWSNGEGYSPRSGYANESYFYNSIKKYGWNEGFYHYLIDKDITEKQAKQVEIRFIELWDLTNKDNGYNETKGGDGTVGWKMPNEQKNRLRQMRLGKKMSDETKEKIRDGNKGKTLSLDTRLKISANNCRYWDGKKLSDSHKNNISKSIPKMGTFYGKKHSDEAKLKMRNAKLGKKMSEEFKIKMSNINSKNNPNAKMVLCEEIVFKSIKLCSEYYGENRTAMNCWITGRNKMPQKYIDMGLRYATQEEIDQYIASKEINKIA